MEHRNLKLFPIAPTSAYTELPMIILAIPKIDFSRETTCLSMPNFHTIWQAESVENTKMTFHYQNIRLPSFLKSLYA